MRREKNKKIVVVKGKRMSLSPVIKFEKPNLELI
jgi:hypothetical protein